MRAGDDSFVRAAVISLAFVVGACATVTRTQTLETEAARTWLRETADQRVSIDAPGDVAATGHIVAATARAVHLQGADGSTIEIPVRDGTTLHEQKRGRAVVLGTLAGICIGLTTGLILYDRLGSPNPDSAGGVEHPPLVVPLGLLAGALVGAVVGAVVGSENRLLVDSKPGAPVAAPLRAQ